MDLPSTFTAWYPPMTAAWRWARRWWRVTSLAYGSQPPHRDSLLSQRLIGHLAKKYPNKLHRRFGISERDWIKNDKGTHCALVVFNQGICFIS